MAFFDAAPMSYSGVQPKQDRKSYLSVVTKHQKKFRGIYSEGPRRGLRFYVIRQSIGSAIQARHLNGVFDAAPMSHSGVQPKLDRKSHLSVVTKHQRKFLGIIPRDRDEGYVFTLFVRAFAPPLQARHLDGVFFLMRNRCHIPGYNQNWTGCPTCLLYGSTTR